NSWGDDGTRAYTTWCRQIDQFSYDFEDDVIMFAVSDGSIVTTPENANSTLAVSSTYDAPIQDTHGDGGIGPTADGRRKPEIMAPGMGTISANYATPCGYTSDSGTSMACPVITAAALLTRQYFVSGFYPSGAARSTDILTPSGALLRALLINSSVDMTGEPG